MSKEFFSSTKEAVAFGLFCDYADGNRAVIHLNSLAGEGCKMPADDIREGFAALAKRRLVDVLQDMHKPDRLVVEFPDPEMVEPPHISPHAYYRAVSALLSVFPAPEVD